MNGRARLKLAIWIACFISLTALRAQAAPITLAWNANSEPDLAGYVISYGTAPGQYTGSVDVGNTTTHTLTELLGGFTYYFSVQAYNTNGGTSLYSNEVSALIPAGLSVTSLTANRTSPQTVGTTTTFTASANGGTPPYQYKFWIVNGTAQTIGRDWSTSNSFAWTPSSPSSSYAIRVWARNASSTADAPENPAATLETAFVITTTPSGPNQPPSGTAGPDQTIRLPSSATMNATVTDDGLPSPPGALTLTWTRVSGPGTVTFGTQGSATTTATFSLAGTYVLRLTVSDGALSPSDTVTVTVQPAVATSNQPPTVNAGADRSITLPGNTTLTGTVTDDGLPTPPGALTLSWTSVSGPGTVAFGTPSAATTTATFTAAGTYVLRLTASDGALSRTDDVSVTVNASGGSGPAGLVAQWRLDEGTGTSAGAIGGAYGGTLVNGATWTAGRHGGAVAFDGTNDYISLPSMDVGTAGMTITAWVRSTAFPSSVIQRFVSKASGSSADANYWTLGQVNSGGSRLAFRIRTSNGGTTTLVASSGTLPLNTWYHAAATYDGAQMRLYLNGVLVGSVAKTGTVSTNAAVSANLGRSPEGSNYMSGALDDARIYNRALSAAEIAALMTTP